jgi:hypothetical protein
MLGPFLLAAAWPINPPGMPTHGWTNAGMKILGSGERAKWMIDSSRLKSARSITFIGKVKNRVALRREAGAVWLLNGLDIPQR